ncbi:MAG: hypothetical protein V4722_23545 [Bacteroidota bacterium]
MPVTEKLETRTLESFKKIGFDSKRLVTLKPTILTNLEIAKKLGVRPEALSTSVTLSPNKPRTGKNFLSMYAAMMVIANPAASNNIALFSSAFPSAVNPGVQVEFEAIKSGKKHLVEFNISLNEPEKVYKFRVFQYPTATFQDISISGSQVISVLIPASAGISSYGASISQQNTKAEACGWIFHSLKISSVD